MKKWLSIFSVVALVIAAVCFFRSHTETKYQDRLAICAMFKNEASWLKEWIEYHRVLGATHFYLYNNDSADEYEKVLQPYVGQGIVELIDWGSSEEHAIRGIEDASFIPYQLGAYNDCLKNRALGKAQWVAVIDIDEFIVPTKGKDAFIKLLDKEARAGTGTLRLPWRIFGTSHIADLAVGELLTEKLCYRAVDEHPWNRNVKSIHRPEAIDFCLVHENKTLRDGFKRKRLKGNEYRVHHYWTRTENFLAQKRKLTTEEKEKFSQEFNAIEDRSIFSYLPQLKQNLADWSFVNSK